MTFLNIKPIIKLFSNIKCLTLTVEKNNFNILSKKINIEEFLLII